MLLSNDNVQLTCPQQYPQLTYKTHFLLSLTWPSPFPGRSAMVSTTFAGTQTWRKLKRLKQSTYMIALRARVHRGSSIIHLTHVNVWESIGKPCSCMQFRKSCIFYYKSHVNPYQYCKSCENLYQVLQVTCTVSERAMRVHMIKSLSPQYQTILEKISLHCYRTTAHS